MISDSGSSICTAAAAILRPLVRSGDKYVQKKWQRLLMRRGHCAEVHVPLSSRREQPDTTSTPPGSEMASVKRMVGDLDFTKGITGCPTERRGSPALQQRPWRAGIMSSGSLRQPH